MTNPKPISQSCGSSCTSGYCPAQRPLRGPSGLEPAWPGSRCVLASPDAPPAHAARGVRRLTPPRTRTARPKRMHRGPHTRGALGAALALHARRAPLADGSSRPVGEPKDCGPASVRLEFIEYSVCEARSLRGFRCINLAVGQHHTERERSLSSDAPEPASRRSGPRANGKGGMIDGGGGSGGGPA